MPPTFEVAPCELAPVVWAVAVAVASVAVASVDEVDLESLVLSVSGPGTKPVESSTGIAASTWPPGAPLSSVVAAALSAASKRLASQLARQLSINTSALYPPSEAGPMQWGA